MPPASTAHQTAGGAYSKRSILACFLASFVALALILVPVSASNSVINPINPTTGNLLLKDFVHDATSGTLSGSIWVRNIAFSKVVRVFYSNPAGAGWAPTNFIEASYASTGTSSQEMWSFSATNPASFQPGTQFYVMYTVAGANYYDNNSNANYKIPAPNAISVALNPFTPATGNIKVISYSYDGSSTLTARFWVKNLAFNKIVNLKISTPASNGATITVPAAYTSTAANLYEIWTATSSVGASFGATSQLSVDFTVNGVLYSDGPYVVPSTGLTVPTSTVSPPITTTTTTSSTVVEPPTTTITTTTTTVIVEPPSTSTTTTTTTTTSITVPPTFPPVPPTRPHPEGPKGQAVLLESYVLDPNTGVLSGGVWVKPGSSAVLEIVCSDSKGLFTPSTTTILGTFSSASLVPGYDYWKFSGTPNGGGAGMMVLGKGRAFFLKYTASGTTSFDSNGGPWYNYRVDFPKFVPAGWKGRSVYQVVVDRFSRTDGSTNPCDFRTIFNDYCGGTWRGLINKLDYITGMGFDAIWISAVVDNTPGGYHGYWPRDFGKTNDRFGSEADLRALIAAAHDRNMLVMIDTVPNHVGPLNGNAPNQYPAPLNKPSNYHNYCEINYSANPQPPQSTFEFCRINPVNPDLNTEDPETINFLYEKMRWLDSFGADGYRLDAVRHIRMDFWPGYIQAAGNKFCLGEVATSFTPYVGSYQKVMASVHAYPTFYGIIRNVFNYKNSMKSLDDQHFFNSQAFTDVSVLGVFIDNHDQDRFLKIQPDLALLRNALAYTFFHNGLPNIYQGTEQAFADAGDYRRPVWDSGFNTTPSAGLYQWIGVMLKARRDIGRQEFVDAFAVKAGPENPVNTYVFSRKPFLVALTNLGTGSSTSVRVRASFGDNKVLRNILIPTDTIAPGADGFYTINLQGEPKIYV
ncbi:Alpha-amylase A type-1/2 [Dinochytrium kinnereticum]|nr:Alpha-amylase A type-1/2 [Dinochytrium kinnereticum]